MVGQDCIAHRRRDNPGWHPSFLTLLLDALPDHWSEIVKQISLENTGRARELEHADPRQPGTFWPQLHVISCWGEGHGATLFMLKETFQPMRLNV